MLLAIHPVNPDKRKMQMVCKCLQDGGVVILPTDTLYAFTCLLNKAKSIERIARLRDIKPQKANFSLICPDLSNLTDYVRNPDNSTFKLMRKLLPGPYTFILHAGNRIPKFFNNNRKEVGIRVPNHPVPVGISLQCNIPLVSTSVHDLDDVIEYTTDPELIHERFKHEVDMVIDSGPGGNIPSTIIDCTGDEPVIVREGLGNLTTP